MSKSEKFDAMAEERNAAMMLLKDYIAQHPSEVANAIVNMIPFFQDCSIEGLRGFVNVVNVTFATIALDVIKSNVEDDDFDKLCLPVDATEMRHSIFYLSKVIDALQPLALMIRKNEDYPAFKMTASAYCKNEIFG